MRLKIGFILRSLLVVGSFLGLVVLWSSLSPRLDDPSPLSRMRVSDTPAPSGSSDPQLVLFARASGESRGWWGRTRRWRRSSAGGAGAARADPGLQAPRTLSPLSAAGPPPRRPFLLRFPAPGFAAANGAAAAGPSGRFPPRDCWAEREESSVPAWVGVRGARPLRLRFLGAGTAVAARERGVGSGGGLWRGQA